jgi:hypothetical protein
MRSRHFLFHSEGSMGGFQKAWYKSKTILFNILAVAVVILAMPEFTNVLPPEWMPYAALAVALGNMARRTVTTTAIGAKDE